MTTPIAFFWGDDAWSLEVAVEAFRSQAAVFPGGVPERWRVLGSDGPPARILGALQERLATGSMFGAGTLAVVAGAGPLIRRGEDRRALIAVLDLIAPGNGLVIVEETESGRKEPPHKPLVEAVRAAGGREQSFRAPRAGELTSWIEKRAAERGIRLAQGAAREVASRIGGFVTEGDVDRRQQGQLAVMELEKLALYRIDGPAITVDDVRALTPEAVPGSLWALTDAVGLRETARAVELLERTLEAIAEPVVVAVLHRRIRELLEVADRLGSGESARTLPRSMKLASFRAEQLARQASRWSLEELGAALDGLLELDAAIKGIAGTPVGDAQHHLGFVRWVGERVARR